LQDTKLKISENAGFLY